MAWGLVWSLVWIALALAFNAGIYFSLGSEKALEFFTGYLIEKSLSVDNLFVFIMIFSSFGVRSQYQARILKWGIIGALVMRAIFIFAGVELLGRFQWLFYLFGALLMFTAVKMAFGGEGKIDPERNLLVRAARKLLPVTRKTRGDWFITRRRGMWVASPLLLALLMVEWSDLVFAVDSIPAIFAVTLDPFIVFTSNIFAIMGLRALYFLLAGVMALFVYLKFGISFPVLCRCEDAGRGKRFSHPDDAEPSRRFEVDLDWRGPDGPVLSSGTREEISGAGPGGGHPGGWNPEELLLGALGLCLTRTFEALARREKLHVARWHTRVEARLGPTPYGPGTKVGFTLLTTHVELAVPPDEVARARDLAVEAKQLCVGANALMPPVHLDLAVEAAEPALSAAEH